VQRKPAPEHGARVDNNTIRHQSGEARVCTYLQDEHAPAASCFLFPRANGAGSESGRQRGSNFFVAFLRLRENRQQPADADILGFARRPLI